MPSVLDVLRPASQALKVAAAVALVAPLGAVIGKPIPRGQARTPAAVPQAIPGAWGINGCASVLGAVLATLLAIHLAFTASWGALTGYTLSRRSPSRAEPNRPHRPVPGLQPSAGTLGIKGCGGRENASRGSIEADIRTAAPDAPDLRQPAVRLGPAVVRGARIGGDRGCVGGRRPRAADRHRDRTPSAASANACTGRICAWLRVDRSTTVSRSRTCRASSTPWRRPVGRGPKPPPKCPCRRFTCSVREPGERERVLVSRSSKKDLRVTAVTADRGVRAYIRGLGWVPSRESSLPSRANTSGRDFPAHFLGVRGRGATFQSRLARSTRTSAITCAPAARSDGLAFSASLWLKPRSHGTNTIPAGN